MEIYKKILKIIWFLVLQCFNKNIKILNKVIYETLELFFKIICDLMIWDFYIYNK